jgi:hypothetical protein
VSLLGSAGDTALRNLTQPKNGAPVTDTRQTVQEWLDRQSEVPDGDGYDALEEPGFPREFDPELHDAVMTYLKQRVAFNDAADLVENLMFKRGWEAR